MYVDFCKKIVTQIVNENRFRIFKNMFRPIINYPEINIEQKKVIIWCSNDYMNMSHNPHVIKKSIQTVKTVGVGSGGTRNIGGSNIYIDNLEHCVAKFLNKEKSLVFGSGYQANLSALSSLGQIFPECTIISDVDNHASMIEGIKRSGANKVIYSHNDMNNLESKLKKLDIDNFKIIAFESVYSMDGSVSNIKDICYLAKKYNALTYCDEIHAVGIYGKTGTGQAEAQGMLDQVDIVMGGFGKAIGSFGGYIGSSKPIIDVVKSLGSSFIFTTSLPPGVCVASQTSINILKKSYDARLELIKRSNRMKMILSYYNIPFIQNESHIIIILINSAEKCNYVTEQLLSHGHYVQPINYPTVPIGLERLRITPSLAHTDIMMQDFVIKLKTILNSML